MLGEGRSCRGPPSGGEHRSTRPKVNGGQCVDDGQFQQPHLAESGLWGWLRLHTCSTLSNQCARVEPALSTQQETYCMTPLWSFNVGYIGFYLYIHIFKSFTFYFLCTYSCPVFLLLQPPHFPSGINKAPFVLVWYLSLMFLDKPGGY